MGVDRSDWIVIGVNIGMENYKDDNYDFYDKYDQQDKLGDMTFLIDGMSGKYFIVGEVLLKGDYYDGFGLNEFPIVETNELNESSARVREFVKKEFDIDNVEDPKLIVLTHFT